MRNKLPWPKVCQFTADVDNNTRPIYYRDYHHEHGMDAGVSQKFISNGFYLLDSHAEYFRQLCELAMSIPAHGNAEETTKYRKRLRLFALQLWQEIFEAKK